MSVIYAAVRCGRAALLSERERDRKSASLAGCAVGAYRSVHGLYDILDDGKTQAGAVDTAESSIPFSLKRFKNMLQEILADTDAGILNRKLVNGMIVWKLFFPGGDQIAAAVGFRVFYGITVGTGIWREN